MLGLGSVGPGMRDQGKSLPKWSLSRGGTTEGQNQYMSYMGPSYIKWGKCLRKWRGRGWAGKWVERSGPLAGRDEVHTRGVTPHSWTPQVGEGEPADETAEEAGGRGRGRGVPGPGGPQAAAAGAGRHHGVQRVHEPRGGHAQKPAPVGPWGAAVCWGSGCGDCENRVKEGKVPKTHGFSSFPPYFSGCLFSLEASPPLSYCPPSPSLPPCLPTAEDPSPSPPARCVKSSTWRKV